MPAVDVDQLEDLQQWYAAQCNGDWEHRRGVKIESCDNPGWWVKIDVLGTALQGRTFTALAESVDPQGFPVGPRWLRCHVQDGVWHGAGDATKLPIILQHFLSWAGSEVA